MGSTSKSLPARMSTAFDSEINRVRLGTQLRELRRAKKLSAEAVAKKSNMSQPKMSRIESGRQVPSVQELDWILDAVKAESVARAEAHLLARRLTEILGAEIDVLIQPDAAATGADLNSLAANATVIRELNGVIISGFLQTAEYALASTKLCSYGASEVATSLRLARQQLLFDPEKHFEIILTESALTNRFLPDAGMRAQHHHILTLTTLGNVEIGVVPSSTLLDFLPMPAVVMFDDDYAVCDVYLGVVGTANESDLSAYMDLYDRARSKALFGDNARNLLEKLVVPSNDNVVRIP